MTEHVPYKLIATRRIMRRNAFIKKIAVGTGAVVSVVLAGKIARRLR